MGQMTFNFETEEKKPEKKQDVEIKEEKEIENKEEANPSSCLLYTSPSPRDRG